MKNNIFRILSLSMVCLIAIAFSYITLGMEEKLQNTTNNTLPVPSSKIKNPQSDTLSNNTSSPVIAKKPSLSNIAQSSLNDGLVAYYPFNGNANDESGNGNNGTINGATLTTDRFGNPDNAYSFDGVDDEILVPHNANLNTGSQITIVAWVNPSSSGHGRPIAQKRSSSNVGGYTFETTHSPFGPDNGLQWVIWKGGTPHTLQTPANVLAIGTYQHVAATFDGTTMKVYVNILEEASMSVSGVIDAVMDPFVIGRNVVHASLVWHGLIDEVRIYNRALSEGEIRELYLSNEMAFEDCGNGIDDDNNGLADCEDPQCCSNEDCVGNSATCKKLVETVESQKATMNDAQVTGDFTSTLDFKNFEIVSITTGSFAGKGFSKGECETTFEGVTYKGEWKGVAFFNQKENRIDLKGAITGEIMATVEGTLTESTEGSGVYDHYQATWKIGRLASSITSAIINVDGYLSYQTRSEYLNTKLYFLQENFRGVVGGDYSGDINTVLTHLRIVSKDNPYVGEGFSIISYTHTSGAGQGWTYDKLVDQGIVDSRGLFTSPLYGVAYNVLNETQLPRLLTTSVLKVENGLPPMADLEVKVIGQYYVSAGETVDYIVEYRNQGVKDAENVIVVSKPPVVADYVSSTGGGIYRWENHEVFWKLGTVRARQRGTLSVKVYFPWGLPPHLPIVTIVLYGTTSIEKDYYLNPDKDPLVDVQDYLDYQPLKKTSSSLLTQEEFEAELALDVEFNDLYQYAIEEGYSYRGSIKETFNEDSVLTRVLMSNSSNEALFLTRVNGQSVLRKYTDSGVTLFGRNGGMTWDIDTDSLESWGDWAVPGSPTFAQCIRNCLLEKAPLYVIKKAIKLVRNIFAAFDCGNCFTSGDPFKCAKCMKALTSIPGVGEVIDISQCTNDCLVDPSKHVCKGEMVRCDKDPISIFMPEPRDQVVKYKCDELGLYVDREVLQTCATLYGFKEICKDGKCVAAPGDLFYTGEVLVGGDPNTKYGHTGAVSAGQKLDYKVEFENGGEGIAYGVYFTDTLDEDLDDSTLVPGPVYSTEDNSEIAPAGEYDASTRTITWFVGEVGSEKGGYTNFSVNVKTDAPRGTEIINYATVYFPSVPEVTPTNAVVSIIPVEDCGNGIDDDEDGLIDCDDPECDGLCPEADNCSDRRDNDGDGFTDCLDSDCPPCPAEICDNGLDDDGDGFTDCDDPDCQIDNDGDGRFAPPCGDDCDDTNPNINPGISEVCGDGLDNDCDRLVDCDDPDCQAGANYIKGAIKFGKKGKGDTAQLNIAIGSDFCDALPGVVTVKLSGCDPITIPVARKGKSATFLGKTANARLVINCKKHTLTLSLKGMALKDCVGNPVKTCISVDGVSCICAEAVFTEKVKKGVLVRLSYP